MSKNSLKTNWRRIAYITLIWVLISVIQICYEFLIFEIYGVQPPENITFLNVLATNMLAGLIAGIVGGYVLVKYMVPWFSKHPFGKALLLLFIFYSLVFLFVIMIIVPLSYESRNLGTHAETSYIAMMVEALQRPDVWRQYFFWLFVNTVTLIGVFVSDKYGPGVFGKFLMGKYFHPKREERIFMFLDIRGSTTIAEKIGEKKYFDFIKKFIDDATYPILNFNGEIYQYVGDEIVISWTMKKGLQDANCIRCFFAITDYFSDTKDHYLAEYGAWPELKAGIHYGEVMVGEMGRVKRDISYSGDVLNTTARIQAECNSKGVDILVSDKMLRALSLNGEFNSKSLGEIQLRGKLKYVELVTLAKEE